MPVDARERKAAIAESRSYMQYTVGVKTPMNLLPKYISEAHRIKLGTMTGKVTETNPLGISHNQEVILKYLQRHNDDWDMRGGRESNGNEYSMNMMRPCEADGSPDEPPTDEPIPDSPINEDATLAYEAQRRHNDTDEISLDS